MSSAEVLAEERRKIRCCIQQLIQEPWQTKLDLRKLNPLLPKAVDLKFHVAFMQAFQFVNCSHCLDFLEHPVYSFSCMLLLCLHYGINPLFNPGTRLWCLLECYIAISGIVDQISMQDAFCTSQQGQPLVDGLDSGVLVLCLLLVICEVILFVSVRVGLYAPQHDLFGDRCW